MTPEQLRYTKTHEWVRLESGPDGSQAAVMGISDFAVKLLTDLVYLNLPAVGQRVQKGAPLGEVESVKAVSDVYSPVSGEVIEVNRDLPEHLDRLSSEPYGAGWLVKIKLSDTAELGDLMDYAAYQKQCAEDEAH